MTSLDIDTLRALATLQGLDCSEEELHALLPLVQAARSGAEGLAALELGDAEPSIQFRVL